MSDSIQRIPCTISDNRVLFPMTINAGIERDNMSTMLVFDIPESLEGLQKRIKFLPPAKEAFSSNFLTNDEYLIPVEITALKIVHIQLEFFGADGEFIANTSMSKMNFGAGIKSDQTFIPEGKENDFVILRGAAFAKSENANDYIIFRNVDGVEVARIKGGSGGGGSNGWTPMFVVIEDGERNVIQITEWTGGSGTPPDTGYLSPTGIVSDITQASNVRGSKGETGIQGIPGIGLPGKDGLDGADGFSPTIDVYAQTETEYILEITDTEGAFKTPNLIGPQGEQGESFEREDIERIERLENKALVTSESYEDEEFEIDLNIISADRLPIDNETIKINLDGNIYAETGISQEDENRITALEESILGVSELQIDTLSILGVTE